MHSVQAHESSARTAGGFKAARAQQQREGAGNRAAWNALFMRPDTVAQAIASHFDVTKSELLDRDVAGAPAKARAGKWQLGTMHSWNLHSSQSRIWLAEISAWWCGSQGRTCLTNISWLHCALQKTYQPATAFMPEFSESVQSLYNCG